MSVSSQREKRRRNQAKSPEAGQVAGPESRQDGWSRGTGGAEGGAEPRAGRSRGTAGAADRREKDVAPEGRAGASQMVGLRLQSLVPVNFCSRPSAPPFPQLRPPPVGPATCPGSSLVAWLRRRFRPWGPTDMAAATTALSFSFASSSSSALLRPGLAPLRRWRALTGPAPRAACSASSSPCSADRYAAPIGAFFPRSFFLLLLLGPLTPRREARAALGGRKGHERPEGAAGSAPLGIGLGGGWPRIPDEFGGSSRENGGVFPEQCISCFCSVLLVSVFCSCAKGRCSCHNDFPEVFVWCVWDVENPVVMLHVILGF
ncbi:uncharacterized protein LOC113980226 isoform X2 [Neopelma chrysocephalum]|uniref:uncharacterized protein LOC113980226 isoform X2 n=1 Tax=Neopelma chrysocephalum TaxID=114329 RepID=UPI000FCD0465|nr:uncharacterized protein LOC113980226 isoform X2 [Neopelma chrysocephalum]